MELRTNRLIGAMLAGMRRRGERGATAVEYALLVVAVGMFAVVVIKFGGVVGTIFDQQTCRPAQGLHCCDKWPAEHPEDTGCAELASQAAG